MSNEELSKRKYIYEVYKAFDNQLHVERHSVIYANSFSVYFKQARKQDLTNISIFHVKDTWQDCDLSILTYSSRMYFWNADDLNMADIEKLNAKFNQKKREARLKELRSNVDMYNQKLEQALQEIAQLLEKESEVEGNE